VLSRSPPLVALLGFCASEEEKKKRIEGVFVKAALG